MTARLKISLLAAGGLFLLQLGWILSMPPHVGIDEFDHALRASSVAEGHWEPGDHPVTGPWGRGDLIPVRSDVAESVRGACELRSSYTGIFNCNPAQDLGDGTVLIASAAGRYNPVYYAFAGLAAAPFTGNANLYALRTVSALFCSVLFFLTVWIAAGRARSRWPVAVLVLAALPTTVYSTAVAAPNGAELLAGLGTWVALLALTDDETAHVGQRRSTYLLLGLFVAVLANTHTTGLLWLALTGVAVAVLRGPLTALRALRPRGTPEVAVAALTVIAVGFEIAWVLISRVNDPADEGMSVTGSPLPDIASGLLLWPLQAIGAYPLRDEPAPMIVYGLVIAVLVAVVAVTARRTRLRSRAAASLGFVLVASYLVPAVLTAMSYSSIGSAWQGRYGMPFTVGLLVLAGRQLDRSDRPIRYLGALAAAGTVVMVGVHLISQWAVMTNLRSSRELVTATDWSAPGPLLLVGLGAAALACWLRAVVVAPAAAHVLTATPERHARELVR